MSWRGLGSGSSAGSERVKGRIGAVALAGFIGLVLARGWLWVQGEGALGAVSGVEPRRVNRARSVGGRGSTGEGAMAREGVPGSDVDEGAEVDPERPGQVYDRVVDACGFDIEERCVDGACGAVVEMPDLDRFDGWLRLLWEQPGVVGSTAARDLGLPLAWTPCGDALMGSPDVWAAQVSWDRELWCVGDPRACDLAAAERYGWHGFSQGARLTRRAFLLDGGR